MARLVLILSFLLLFTAPAAFAFDGLSIGVGLGVAMDDGNYKDPDLNKLRTTKNAHLDRDSTVFIPESSLVVRYDFSGPYFIMTGIEFSKLATGNELKGNNDSGDVRVSYEYACIAVPFIIGINIPVRRGRYNIYAGLGPSFVQIKFEKEYDISYYDDSIFKNVQIRGRTEGDTDGPGTAFMAGISVNITRDLHLSIEYQKLHSSRYTTIEGSHERWEDGAYMGTFKTEDMIRLSAPDNTIRFGLVYDI